MVVTNNITDPSRRMEMALNEACQLWIEQRIDEELESQPETGKSDRAIGREVSGEVAKLFETFVSEDAIRIRAASVVSSVSCLECNRY